MKELLEHLEQTLQPEDPCSGGNVGEFPEPTVHVAREEGIQFISAGHHATEPCGVQALGEYLASRFSLEHRFIDVPPGVRTRIV